MIDKSLYTTKLSETFNVLNETDRKVFSRVVNKLLNETFIVKDKEEDRADYFFATEHKEMIEAYFVLIDYEFCIERLNGLVYIKTTENRNRVRLTKFDTVVILILRRMYYAKKKELTLDNKVIASLEEIIEQVKSCQVFKDDKKVNSYVETLRKLRQHKVIDYVATKIDENTNIQILPSIQVIISQDNIEDITMKLNALKKDNEKGDEIDEDFDED